MHGLVILDNNDEILHPSIIWCDSRSVEIGERALIDFTPKVLIISERYLQFLDRYL